MLGADNTEKVITLSDLLGIYRGAFRGRDEIMVEESNSLGITGIAHNREVYVNISQCHKSDYSLTVYLRMD